MKHRTAVTKSRCSEYSSATLWELITYKCFVCADPPPSQTTIDHLVDALGLQWQKEAAILADDPQAYQLLLEAEVRGAPAYQSAAGATADRPCLDAELLLRARSCMSAQQPAMACEALLLLLERSLMKEQLAAGLLHQEGGSTAKADDSIWARVRPMPPGKLLQLVVDCKARV